MKAIKLVPSAVTVRRESLHEQITRQIALTILRDGKGDRERVLPTEPELCRHFDISRTVLREAVKVLAAKGLVEVRPKIGMRVRPRSEWNMLDPDLLTWQCEAGPDALFVRHLCEVRLLVEPAAAKMAAERATDEEMEALERWYQEMENAVEDPDAFIPADMEFHSIIFTACHNDILRQMNATIGAALRASQDIVKSMHDGSSKAALALHKEVADAIRQHDGPAARSAMERLVKQAARDLYQVLHLDSIYESPELDV